MVSFAANPGGTLPPAQIYDRDELTARLWRTLTRQSVYLSAERRMGKTSVLRKMLADPPPDVAVIACDLEKVTSPAELVEALLQAINEKLPQLLRACRTTSTTSFVGFSTVSHLSMRRWSKRSSPRPSMTRNDAWGFEHYVTRLEPYYGDDAPLVGDMLDIVALSGPLPFDRLVALLSTRREVFEKDRDRLRRLTDLIQKDHYLVQDGDVLRFRLRLVARAWARRRHLGAP